MATVYPAGTYPHMIVNTSGVVHYMRLNESSGGLTGDDADSLTGNWYGISYSQPGAIAGDSNKSIYFDGGGTDYVTFGNNVANVGAFSMEIWIKPTAARTQTFLSKENYVSPWSGWSWWLDGTSMVPVFDRLHDTRGRCRGTGISANQWTHLVVTYDGSVIRQYQNGTLTWEQPDSVGMYTSSYPAIMGAESNSSNTFYSSWYQGYADDLSTYNRALSGTEVKDHYNRGITAPVYNVELSETRTIFSSESRSPIRAILIPRSDGSIIRANEAYGSFTFLELADGGTISGTETSEAVATFSGIVHILSDSGTVRLTTESYAGKAFPSLSDRGSFFAYEDKIQKGFLGLTDTGTVNSTETCNVQSMTNVAKEYPSLVIRQRGFMHIAAQELFNGQIFIQYRHRDLVQKGVPTESHFLVKSKQNVPLALGKITTTWETGQIVIEMFKELDEHPNIMKQFGYYTAVQG